MSRMPEVLTKEEYESILSFLESKIKNDWSGWKHLRNVCMYLLMLDAGLRVGEVVSLFVKELVLGNVPVTALNLTGSACEKDSERIIPLSPRLQDVIGRMYRLLWSAVPCNYDGFAFFDESCNSAISIRQVQRIITHAGLTAIGRPIRCHVLRHTFATRLMRVTNTRVVQTLLGHKNLSSTQIYTHPNSVDLTKAINQISTEKEL